MIERPTFSPFWHRVRSLRPRLRPHVEITRQHYRRRRWHIAHDPAGNNFYRLNPVAHDFIASLDGNITIEDAWKLAMARHADAAPTQNEVIELLSQLHSSNLLSLDAPPETEQLLRRGRERKSREIKQQLIGLMYLRLRIFNPDAIITALEPFFRPLINRLGLALWALLIISALAMLAPRWGDLAASVQKVASPDAWPWILVLFVLLKLWHELGHGVICKRFGGQVPEFGIMLLVLFPAPFVDASACWAFPSRWRRMAVGCGGMIFELAAAAIACFTWCALPPGHPGRDVAFYVMFTAGISTVLFNANPLMRFDGYYVLSDLLEIPNLMQRSNQMLKHLLKRSIYGIPNLRPPTTLPGEAAILIIYGFLSFVYRIFLFLIIALWLLGFFFVVGLLLAIWTAAAWFILPMGSFAHWLASAPELSERRPRAILASFGLTLATALLVGIIPFPDYRRGEGVVESVNASGVFVGVDGFVAEAYQRPGDRVQAGELILTIVSPELEASRLAALAQIASAKAKLSEALSNDDPANAGSAQRELAYWEQSLADIDRRRALLVVRAPHDGVVVGSDPALLLGAFVQKGRPVCAIVDLDHLRIAATMNQAEASWLFELPPEELTVAVRPVGDPAHRIEGTRIRPVPAAQRELAHPALGFPGGGSVETSPKDPKGRMARREQFTVYVEAAQADLAATSPGERVRLRFTLPSKPILHQVIDRIQRTIQGRIDI